MAIDPEALYVQLGTLVQTMPELSRHPLSVATKQWLGRAYALVEAIGDEYDAGSFKAESSNLKSEISRHNAAFEIEIIIHRALARAELAAPASAQGAFIPIGHSFDAFAAVGKVFGGAIKNLLIVDPYMDEKMLTDFAPLAAEGISIHLLADQHNPKPSLPPAVRRWQNQHGAKRPLEARLTPPRSLHDRLIVVDGTATWVLTQSFNAIAEGHRSP
jgi:hypothetical protein